MTSHSSDSSVARLSSSQVSSLLSFGLGGDDDDTHKPELVDALASLDAQLAKEVMCDLQSPITDTSAGPLSFQRLTGVDQKIVGTLAGLTIAESLTSESTSREAFEALARYGELLRSDIFPLPTRCTGLLINAVAKSALYARYDMEIDRESISMIQHVFQVIEGNPHISQFIQGTG